MYTLISKLSRLFLCPKTLVFWAFASIFFTQPAHADIIDAFNLSGFVPLVLEIMMNIATSLYKFFVGNGTGLIYIFIYAFLAFYLILYLVKMYIPKDWLGLIGFSNGGEIWSGKETGWSIADNVMKPCIRAIIAGFILLQIKPVYVTEWLVNPFLEFGSIYTEHILQNINGSDVSNADAPKCPEKIAESGWISIKSCDFLIQPVYTISAENNRVIKYGLDFLITGFKGMMTWAPHGGQDILNIITGIMLLVAFISANVFMALLIIQAIFDFCLALIMYPFNVLAWVARKSDKWFDVFPAFNQIIDSLKKLVITMIACAFILCVNVAIVRSLFNWSLFYTGNLNITDTSINFGKHSILWLSSMLTLLLMQNIFTLTRKRLDLYTSRDGHDLDLYNNVTGDAKTMWKKIKNTPDTIKTIVAGGKKITGKK